MSKEEFRNNENHSRLWDRINKNIVPAGAATSKADWPAPIRGDAPISIGPHDPDRATADRLTLKLPAKSSLELVEIRPADRGGRRHRARADP